MATRPSNAPGLLSWSAAAALAVVASAGCFGSNGGAPDGGPGDLGMDGGGPADSTVTDAGDAAASSSGSGSSGASSGAASSGGSGSSSSSGGSSSGSASSSGVGVMGMPCPSPQTQFGNVATGDANAGYTSSVGVRTANELLVFSGYYGPDPVDAGPVGDGGNDVNLIYWQAFDPVTGASLGPARTLPIADSTALGTVYLDDVSVAPTGQIALLYTHLGNSASVGNLAANGLDVAFMTSAGDAGTSPQIAQIVQIESSAVGTPPWLYGPNMGQPHAIWSASSGAFVFSYVAFPAGTVSVRKYLPGGAAAGGDTAIVPTDVTSSANVLYESGAVGTVGPLTGVAFIPGGFTAPQLTLLDSVGNEVGSSLPVYGGPQEGLVAGSSSYYWVDVAGTSQGFVFINGTQPVNEIFVPIVDGGAAVLFEGGIATTLDGGPLPGFRFPGTAGAVIGRAISDDTGGRGGAGVALQFTNAAEFMYVNPDGVTHVGPNQVISHTFGTGDIMALTQFGGSFGVSLYSASEHLTRMAASGCVP